MSAKEEILKATKEDSGAPFASATQCGVIMGTWP